jgi:lysozyme family protein
MFHEFFRERVLLVEGGYVNDPLDHGGMTNLGVTQRTWSHWIGRQATEADMHALTPELVEPMYQSVFWHALCCDMLPQGLDVSVFDHALGNPHKAGVLLQTLVGAKPDGMIGPATVAAAEQFVKKNGILTTIQLYAGLRCLEYDRIVRNDPTQQKYVKGWKRRAQGTADWAADHVSG